MDVLNVINNSPFAWGISSLLVNMGARFITMDLTPSQEAVMRHPITKRVVLICMIFLVTKNITTSILIAAFVIMVMEVLANEKSSLNLFLKT